MSFKIAAIQMCSGADPQRNAEIDTAAARAARGKVPDLKNARGFTLDAVGVSPGGAAF